ncbi:MAG: hypothetical protein KKF67_00030 [Nanoarchaeota archaeon]|nr:hypothetical protein [Nanoarchaeota archaeon]
MYEVHKVLEDHPLFKDFYSRAEVIGASSYFLKGAKGGVAPFRQNCLACYEQRGFEYNKEVVREILENEQRSGRDGGKGFSKFLLDACQKCFELDAPTYLAYQLFSNLRLNKEVINSESQKPI